MKINLSFNIIIALILIAQVAIGCERGFNSLTAISPNGSYTAKSIIPEGFNDSNPSDPVKIILIDNVENSVLWIIPYSKKIKAPPPTEIYPTNQGNIIICGIDEYYIFNKNGEFKYIFRLNTEIAKFQEIDYLSHNYP